MEFLGEIGERLVELNSYFEYDGGGVAALLILITLVVLYSGVPLSFALAGTAFLFAIVTMISGYSEIQLLSPFAQTLKQTLSNQTILSIPLFLFAMVLIEKAGIVYEVMKKMSDHWRQKSYGILYTASLIDLCLSLVAAIICALLVPLAILKLPNYLKPPENENHLNVSSEKTLSDATSPLNYIPAAIILILSSNLIIKSSGQLLGPIEIGPSGLEKLLNLTARDFLSAAILPMIIILGLVIGVQLFRMFKTPRNYVVQNKDLPIEQLKINSRSELLKTLIAPFTYCVAIILCLLVTQFSLVEIGSIAAIGALFLAAYKVAPEKKNIYLNTIISMVSIFVLGNFITILPNEFDFSPINLAALSIMVFFLGYSIYGILLTIKYLSEKTQNQPKEEGQRKNSTFLNKVMLSTLEKTSQILFLIISAALFVIVFNGLGGEHLTNAFYEFSSIKSHYKIIAGLLAMMVLSLLISPIGSLMVGGAILIPEIVSAAKVIGIINTELWIGVVILMSLQFIQILKSTDQPLFHRKISSHKPENNQSLKFTYSIVLLIALILVWYFPSLIMKV
jgi:TRAP-type mannitol/chloroaromatic compound transport system permease large subunit